MTTKQRHWLIGFAMMLGILLFSIPVFFQDVEIMPYFWFSYRLPSPPKIPSMPNWKEPAMPVVHAQDEGLEQQRGWVVRLAAMQNEQQADSRMRQLQAQKINAFRSLKAGDLHVYIGPEFNYQAAQEKMKQLPGNIRQTASVAPYEL